MGDLADDVIASLSQDLDAAARRRLWLVGQIIGRSSVTELGFALETVAKIEDFIAKGCPSDTVGMNGQAGTALVGVNNPDGIPQRGAHGFASTTTSLEASHPAEISHVHRVANRPLLDPQKRDEFIREAARNSDNRHLAQVFGLTVRQAHAIRVGLSKFITEAQAKNGQPASVTKLNCRQTQTPVDRETELKLQEDFLRSRPAAAPTLEDVVRYLRQSGDVVVLNGDNYCVNYTLTLTATELIERANAKRCARRQPPFELTNTVADSDIQGAHLNNGTG